MTIFGLEPLHVGLIVLCVSGGISPLIALGIFGPKGDIPTFAGFIEGTFFFSMALGVGGLANNVFETWIFSVIPALVVVLTGYMLRRLIRGSLSTLLLSV